MKRRTWRATWDVPELFPSPLCLFIACILGIIKVWTNSCEPDLTIWHPMLAHSYVSTFSSTNFISWYIPIMSLLCLEFHFVRGVASFIFFLYAMSYFLQYHILTNLLDPLICGAVFFNQISSFLLYLLDCLSVLQTVSTILLNAWWNSLLTTKQLPCLSYSSLLFFDILLFYFDICYST